MPHRWCERHNDLFDSLSYFCLTPLANLRCSLYLSTSGLFLGWLPSANLRNKKLTTFHRRHGTDQWSDGVPSVLCLFVKSLQSSSSFFIFCLLSLLQVALYSKVLKHLSQMSFTSLSLSMAASWLEAATDVSVDGAFAAMPNSSSSLFHIATFAVGSSVHFFTAASSICISGVAQSS